jgi:hypothetical protein
MMPCPNYPKIETLFKRDEHFHVDTQRIRCPEFTQIARWLVTEKIDGTNIRVSLELDESKCWLLPCPHEYDECREWVVRFCGRTDAAQIPTFLLAYLQDTFTLEKMQNLWHGKTSCPKCKGLGQYDSGEPKFLTRERPGHRAYQCECVEPYEIALYGEGYGARIQKSGGNYREGVSFRLFDVLVDRWWWLDWANVKDVATKLRIKTVPTVAPGLMDLVRIVEMLRVGFPSWVALAEDGKGSGYPAEGVVARTDPYLFDKKGHALRWKLKTKDFGGNNG